MVDPHALAEARSLALHGEVAARIRSNPTIGSVVRARVQEWLEEQPPRAYARAWADVLDGPLDQLIAVLVDEGEHARALRQCSPFAGVIDPRTRWRIHAEVRERLEDHR